MKRKRQIRTLLETIEKTDVESRDNTLFDQQQIYGALSTAFNVKTPAISRKQAFSPDVSLDVRLLVIHKARNHLVSLKSWTMMSGIESSFRLRRRAREVHKKPKQLESTTVCLPHDLPLVISSVVQKEQLSASFLPVCAFLSSFSSGSSCSWSSSK